MPWSVLLARVFYLDALVCAKCGGKRKVPAFLTDPEVVRKILSHLGLETAPLPLVPARARERERERERELWERGTMPMPVPVPRPWGARDGKETRDVRIRSFGANED